MKARLLLIAAFGLLLSGTSCNKDKSQPKPQPSVTSTPAMKVSSWRFIAELGTDGTTDWGDTLTRDASGRIIRAERRNYFHQWSEFIYSGTNLSVIKRWEDSLPNINRLFYNDSVFWGSNGRVSQMKIYGKVPTVPYRIIKYFYSGSTLTERRIIYQSYGSQPDDSIRQVFLYDASGNLVRDQFFDKNNKIVFDYTYTYTNAISNKLYDGSGTSFMDLHLWQDDWETFVFDVFNNSKRIPTVISYARPGNTTETYSIVCDTNANGYVTGMKSNGHQVLNLSY